MHFTAEVGKLNTWISTMYPYPHTYAASPSRSATPTSLRHRQHATRVFCSIQKPTDYLRNNKSSHSSLWRLLDILAVTYIPMHACVHVDSHVFTSPVGRNWIHMTHYPGCIYSCLIVLLRLHEKWFVGTCYVFLNGEMLPGILYDGPIDWMWQVKEHEMMKGCHYWLYI